MEFVQGMQGWLNFQKPMDRCNLSHQEAEKKSHMIVSIHVKKSDKIQ